MLVSNTIRIGSILFLVSIVFGCRLNSSRLQERDNNTIIFGKDVIPNEKTLEKYVDLVLSEYISYDVESLKPYIISQNNEKTIWLVTATMKNRNPLPPYSIKMKIDKNNGRLLHFEIHK